MIYMAGDNNLSADMAYALADIREVMRDKGDKLNLMVYYDGAAIDAPTFYCDFTDYDNPVFIPARTVRKAFKTNRNQNDFPEFDENTAAVTSVRNFVNWCVNDTSIVYEKNGHLLTETCKGKSAEKYALIFSGHSSAFQNLSLMVDSSSNYYMTIPKLRWALEDMTDPQGSLLKQQIDILGFDSCQMGMAELAYEFSKSAKILVASEGNLPSAGWSYGSILSNLISPESDEVVVDEKEVARGFVQQYIEKQSEFLIGGVSVDIAALDLTDNKIDTVIKNLNTLGNSLIEQLHNSDTKIREELEKVIQLAHLECQTYMFDQNVDLKDFCGILLRHIGNFSEDTKLIEDCGNLIKAIDDCVLLCGFSGGAYQFSNGISAFFPWTIRSYFMSKGNYTKLKATYESKDKEDQSPLKDWKRFLECFTYNTLREARHPNTDSIKDGGVSDHETFYPIRDNKIANNPNIFIGSFGGFGSDLVKNTGVGNDKNTGVGNDKNTGVGNDKNTGVGNDKNTGVGNDKNTGVGNDKNTGVGNDKNVDAGDVKNSGIANNKNSGIANNKNTGIGNDKNTGIGNDKGFQLFWLMQFKNIASKWNISGFTKPPVGWKPTDDPNMKKETDPAFIIEAENDYKGDSK